MPWPSHFHAKNAAPFSGGRLSDGQGRSCCDGATTYGSHTAAGKARTLTDPGARVTSWTLDKWGRTLTVDAPNTVDAASSTLNNVTRYSYYPTGRVKAVWGDQTYASFYVYDEQNRMTALRTYRSLAHNTEPVSGTAGYDQTAWSYDAQRGWLSSKRDAAAKGADYTYTAAGRLASRQWARTLPSSGTRVTAAYAHTHGRLTGIDYNDSTPDVSVVYDAMGRYHQVARPGHSWVYGYDAATLRLDTETVTCDTNGDNVGDFTRVLDRSWDSLERNTGWQLKQSSTVLHQNGYAYDNAGRISTVTGMTGNYVYGYVANAPALVSGIMGSADTGDLGTPINANIPVTSYVWEGTRDVLDMIENKIGASSPATISKYDYTVNALGQRTAVAQSGSIFGGTPSIGWGYDARGQVQHANHSTNAHDRYYAYDAIGSRSKSREGVTADSGGMLTSYTANAMNQYSGITLPGSSAVAPVYDHDGNLTEDKGANAAAQARKFEWDAENQLVAVRRASDNALIASYSYDPFGRRIRRKTESIATGGAGEQLFFYDGWNLAAEFVKSGSSWNMGSRYVWGLDLGGSLQGAGGVGGLLEVTAANGLRIRTFHDGHGNITSYSNMITGVTATSQYDAFGKITASSGSPASRFAFSSKLLDPETGYSYYGYRFYDAFTGRWPSRDPIGEAGGLNLYAIVGNDAMNRIDVLGLHCDNCSDLLKNCLEQARQTYESFITTARSTRDFALNALAERGRLNNEAIANWNLHPLAEGALHASNDGRIGAAQGAVHAAYLAAIAAAELAYMGAEDSCYAKYRFCDASYGYDAEGCPCRDEISGYEQQGSYSFIHPPEEAGDHNGFGRSSTVFDSNVGDYIPLP